MFFDAGVIDFQIISILICTLLSEARKVNCFMIS